MQTVAHDFEPDDVVAGHVVLDFVNTVTSRDTSPQDWLDGYSRLIEWAVLVGLLDARAAANLRSQSEESPREAAAALTRARKIREALHDAFVALLRKHSVARGVLDEIETAWKRATSRGRLASSEGRVRFETESQSSGLDLPLDQIVLAAVDLLTELDTERTRICRGHECGWLFIDSSKGGRRVWCDMATCGNLAKSQRFARAEKRRRRKA